MISSMHMLTENEISSSCRRVSRGGPGPLRRQPVGLAKDRDRAHRESYAETVSDHGDRAAGHPGKRIVENHRASIMRKIGAKSLPASARLALVAISGRKESSRL